MADLNSLIAQGTQFQAPVDPFANYSKMQQLNAGATQNALAKYQLSSAQRADTLNEGMLNYMRSPEYKPEGLTQFGTPGVAALKAINEAQNAGLTGKKLQGEIEAQPAALAKVKGEIIDTELKRSRESLDRIDPSSPTAGQQLMQWHLSNHQPGVLADTLAKAGVTTEQTQGNIQAAIAQGPRGIADFIERSKVGQTQFAQNIIPHPREIIRGDGSKIYVDDNPRSPTFNAEIMKSQAAGMTPYQVEQNKISQGQLKVSQGQLANAQNRLQAEMSTGNLTPATVDFVAETYRQTGQMPPLGMGPMAATARSKILSRAAELSMGSGKTAAEGAADVRANKAETAGATASQRTLGNQIANVQIAANEANKMIDVAKPYVDKVNPTDYPTLNAAGNYVAAKTGDTNIVGLATALNGLVNTYARAINPKGTATVSDKQHAREIINTAMSKGQLNEAFAVMNQEMGAALASGPETRAAMRPNITKPPAAPATTKSGSTVSNW